MEIQTDGSTHKRVVDMRMQRPAVTREQYERGREVLDALPPGIYLKCDGCRQWQKNGTIHLPGKNQGPLCEKCGGV